MKALIYSNNDCNYESNYAITTIIKIESVFLSNQLI